ncbi:2',3'-cyclic-nucleotide 2'-phosphodiesterase/5'-or 3'-nucleotidase, 5'-nucleotidase family [Haladaptatus litoreus]|uniref:2',3'-cyclic-nucleotide 2'-phosphodiesterase/5'-or 3'-nucleotidase, 5'-nucleotidase family n=1 Tax=Haladaptatus litoreus TaxID=553468 RepID=A0A1N6Z1N2_9EURY|nr:5'-nucleotidase C-terminal domain-containing protein [Haladaptatus litoreus]SIR20631.1 2',3'-cyclic-nucleotide 2'-phosphodiesterase/5'-or 3'-nucleotidase, 5'-nucleotidase family [Haladaptatus litoreus]
MALRLLHYSDVENAYDDPDHIGRLAGCINSLRDDKTLVVGTGDNTAPGVLSLVTEGGQALDFFDAVSPDFDTFGNHDFDYGADRARELVRNSPQTWLTANIRENGDRFAVDAGTASHEIRELGAKRIGFFGLTTPKTPALNPNVNDLDFLDPLPIARKAVSALRDSGADYIVALSHLGQGDRELAKHLDIDVILGGHVHSERVEQIEGTVVTRPGVNGHVLLEIELDSEPTVSSHRIVDAPVDDKIADAMADTMATTGLDTTVGTVETAIERTETTMFHGESRIGNFVADAYRWATDADIGLQNSGGIREGKPLVGDVTVADLVSVIPFQEHVAVAELSGEELCDVFRQAHDATIGFGEPGWWHAHVSGVELVWNRAKRDIESVAVGGEQVCKEETYSVATTEYLLHTDEEFPALHEGHRVETGDVQYEVLADYAREFGIDPEIDGRITRQ